MSHSPRRLTPRIWQHDWLVLSDLRKSLKQILERHNLLSRHAVIVDFGCGDRPYEPIFRQAGCRYIACDLDGSVDVRFEPEGRLGLADQSADGVVSFQVLEHVWNIDWYLRECARVLKPGGWLLLSTHGTWLFHPHPTDFRRWTKPGLEAEVRSRGFNLVETLALGGGPLAWTLTFRLIAYREVLSKIPFLGSLLLPFVATLMNLRAKVEDFFTPDYIRSNNASVYMTLSYNSALAPSFIA